MSISDLSRAVLVFSATLATLAGCGGRGNNSLASSPPGGLASLPATSRKLYVANPTTVTVYAPPKTGLKRTISHSGAPLRDRDGSWMLPEARTTKELLYISDATTEHVYVYNYLTRRLLGRLDGLYQPSGQCVDASGNIWIADSMAEAVVEYTHGTVRYSNRLRTLGRPNGCSVDPTSGSLAVSIGLTKRGTSTIEVFDLTGRHNVYAGSEGQKIQQVGYDNHGNLYVAAASLDFSAAVC